MNASTLQANTVILSYSFHAWRNYRKVVLDDETVTTTADKSRLRLTKKLIESDEYQAILSHFSKTRSWLMLRSVPMSFFRDGMVLVSTFAVETVEDYLSGSSEKLIDLVEDFVQKYPRFVDEARIALGDLFSELDYPSSQSIRSRFAIRWHWLRFSTETLPEGIRSESAAKLEAMWEESIGQIQSALRVGLQELVDYAIMKLRTDPGEKPRVLRSTFVEKVKEFLDTFSLRNVVGDVELAILVERAKAILSDVTVGDLRDLPYVRNAVLAEFETLKSDVDAAVVEVAGRKFDFSD